MTKVKNALLDLNSSEQKSKGFQFGDHTEIINNFSEAQDNDCAVIRKWIITFGLLEEPAGNGTK